MLKTISKFYKFAGERKQQMVAGLVFTVVTSIFESLQFLAVSVVIKDIVHKTITYSTIKTSFILMSISIMGVIVFSHLSKTNSTKGSFLMCSDHRLNIGNKIKYMPMGFFNSKSLGKITTTVTSTMELLQDIAPRVIENVIYGFVNVIILITFLAFFDIRIVLISISGIITFNLINYLMQKKSLNISTQRVKTQAKHVGSILEYIKGMSVIKSFNRSNSASKSVEDAIKNCEKWNVKLELTFIPLMMIQSLILKATSVGIVISSILYYINGTMPLEMTLLMIVFSFIIFTKLDTAGSISALMRIIDISLDEIAQIYSSPEIDTEGIDIIPDNFDIVGTDINFSYSQMKTIDNISFNIPQGSTVAVIGPSGSGKTTLCKLIARFWDIDSGIITLGGHKIESYNMDSLLSNISIVFQDVYLFNESILDNIRFGKSGATYEEVKDAAKKACCHDFITELPNGYDTVLGESGSTISGGEKQRISIARAILKDASIIILDEATSNIDPENENLLQNAISELTYNKTVIKVAHKLNTIRHADQIFVMDRGKIVQRGTHEQLIEKEGIYRNFISVKEESVGWCL